MVGKRKGPHRERRLTATAVRNLQKPGRYTDGRGLYLVVGPSGAKKWVLRIVVQGRRRDIGLGGYPDTSLADAREDADKLRKIAKRGGDPLQARRKERQVVPTFEEAARKVHESLKPTWKNPKHADQWINTLDAYAFPHIGKRPVDTIDSRDILQVLAPIWVDKPETARRVRQRLSRVMNWVRVSNYRLDNPVDGVEQGLPSQPKGHKHHPALPYSEVPAFIEKLRTFDAALSCRLALEFTILTATRTTEVREATWAEIDFETKTWSIPAERMKSPRPHRVPLSQPAIDVLSKARELSGGDPDKYVFPGKKHGKPLSNMAMLQVLRRMGVEGVVHGFRSTFRDWCAERTSTPDAVAEAALAHANKDKTEASYKRTDYFEQRVKLMETWGAHVTGAKAEVVQLRA